MKKIWSYIALFFIGLSAGIAVGVKWLGDKTVFKGSVRIKQRGKGNVQKPEIIAEIDEKQANTGVLSKWRQRRIERKKKRALRRLEKID